MKTRAEFTNEVLAGWLMNNNEVNAGSLAENIWITAINTRHLYDEITQNTRRKIRNIAITLLMYWIDENIKYNGHAGYYATNKQVMNFDKNHGGSLKKVLDIVEAYVQTERDENK